MLLHKEKGLNPRVVVCRRCGKDTGLIFLGAEEWIWECCAEDYIGKPKKCRNCGSSAGLQKVRRIGDNDKIPDGLCKECKEEIEELMKVVDEGGVYWRCVDCKKEGVIKGGAPLAQAVRKQLGIAAPEPCGAEFGKSDCPACGQDKEEEHEPSGGGL